MQPTQKDIEIIEWVYQCRRAHIPHLVTPTKRSRQKLNSRLVRLVEQGYLHVLKRPFQHYIYSIGRRATPILVERGIATHVEVERRAKVREASELFLNHETATVHAAQFHGDVEPLYARPSSEAGFPPLRPHDQKPSNSVARVSDIERFPSGDSLREVAIWSPYALDISQLSVFKWETTPSSAIGDRGVGASRPPFRGAETPDRVPGCWHVPHM